MIKFTIGSNRHYIAPGGQYYELFNNMTKQPHLLVAGTTGSGKSVLINGIIYTLLLKTPGSAKLILIDPKRVELSQYKHCPHVIYYADKQQEMIVALQTAVNIIEARYTKMQQQKTRYYAGSDIYIVIDELADIMMTCKKQAAPLIQRICQIGRAARVHMIAATQRPTSDVIPANITCNIDSRVGLHTRNTQESRNVIYSPGCETLPRYGQCIYMTPEKTTCYNVPMYTETQLDNLVQYWTSKKCFC